MVADQNLWEENHVTPTDSFRRTDNNSGRRRKRFRPDSGSIRRHTPGFCLQTFLLDQQVKHLSYRTIRFYGDQIRPFLAWCQAQGVRQPGEVRALHVRCHPHTLRRTFALWSLRNGMSMFHLQRLMGHADIAMLRRYLDLLHADLQTAHAEHGVVDHMK